ncbi:MAG TPA: hypothetical protein VFJ79_04315 [Acidimicrobiales bacterium]|nr:hypothetical protein [Acidimicrobiales bacterium]
MSASLEEAARLAGAHCWSERRMFEILGGWVGSTQETHVKLMLDRHAQHHAWRATQWWDRLPVLADVDRDTLLVAPTAAVSKAMDGIGACSTAVSRLAAAYRFALPRMFTAYQHHRAAASPVSDASAMRTLGLVGPDLASDWGEGEATLQGLIRTEASADEAAETVGRLERLLAAG